MPPWPLPKIFRLTQNGKINEALFRGETINTPSMLAVEDQRDALIWAESIGGLPALIARSQSNLTLLSQWVDKVDWVDFLAAAPATRSSTAMCLKITAPFWQGLDETEQRHFIARMTHLLARDNIAFDIGSYRSAPLGLRLWGGATVEQSDLAALLPWLEWAFDQVRHQGA